MGLGCASEQQCPLWRALRCLGTWAEDQERDPRRDSRPCPTLAHLPVHTPGHTPTAELSAQRARRILPCLVHTCLCIFLRGK